MFFLCITSVNADVVNENSNIITDDTNSSDIIINETKFSATTITTNTNNISNSNVTTTNKTSDSNKTLSIVVTSNKVVDYVKPASASRHSTKIKPTKLSQNSITLAASYLNRYVYVHGKLPKFVKISGYKFSIPEFLYLISKTIQYKKNKKNSNIPVKYNLKDPQNIRGTSIYGNISFSKFYKSVLEVIDYMNYYKVAPNYIDTSIGSMQYQTIVFIFSKVLARNEFPTKIDISIKCPNTITKSTPKYVRPGTKNPLNSRYTGGSLAKYLKSSKNCQSNSVYIKKMAKKITKGCNTKLAKAKAIYYWVRDNMDYTSYYNTRYGAKKAIANRKGNCVDLSHAIIALCRASKIPARYVHGRCKFVSGNWYGHVWVQIKVGKTWYVADASNNELNGFGVVNNWRSDKYYIHGRYSSLRF
ncbi:transglutaminase-like domain-containing protein [Methanobrevibacter sp. TMH8]|uniref:transglutaminase-like domain-containing protein n=1 Tax=Methanobrevibacter sp. TMH8 TaxID=2848611 RepID=UPI001CCC9E13|nr:transglutaminase-like domain-containing protein [Methanobrevibacter sp. TMH8]MBZ9571012.1 transglutaminase-like domain-containing protein [Methanobrevibacter sp. TMH8]